MFDSAFTEYLHNRAPEISAEQFRIVAHSRKRANALLTEALSLLKSQVN